MGGEPSYEEGDRRRGCCARGLTGKIQIMEATVLGVIDDYPVTLGFRGGEEMTDPVCDLTPMPASRRSRRAADRRTLVGPPCLGDDDRVTATLTILGRTSMVRRRRRS